MRRLLFSAALLACCFATLPFTPQVGAPVITVAMADGGPTDPPFNNGGVEVPLTPPDDSLSSAESTQGTDASQPDSSETGIFETLWTTLVSMFS